jgi:hypothetical protein
MKDFKKLCELNIKNKNSKNKLKKISMKKLSLKKWKKKKERNLNKISEINLKM